jgi:phosphoenolpyruvate-protein phosphotransferase
MSRRLTGRGAAPGVALAPAAVIRPSGVAETRAAGTPEEERALLDDALGRAAEQLRDLAERITEEVGEDEGEIFEAHAEFADDPELAARAHAAVGEGSSAEEAVTGAFGSFRELLEASGSEYLAARAADLDDVRDRVLTLLSGGSFEVEAPERPSVIVAHELSPSQTASIPREVIEALVTETGSPTSHAAILARSLGVPAVVGAAGVVDLTTDGVVVAVDGRSGELVLDPDQRQRAEIERRLEAERRRREELAELREELGRTADGRRVELAANLGSRQDLDVAVAAGAEGSGLVRTEFLYLDRTSAPSVAEQTAFVEEVLRTFPGHRVVVRTLDVGADKPLPFVAREEEPNPALGLRGIRMSLARPGLFRDQLRALLAARAAVGDDGARLAIMFPLVSLPAELAAARRHLAEVAEEEGHALDGLEVGVMVETPAAALAAAALADQSDFLSVGTNDLLQYLFAADRMVAGVGELADACDPVVLALLADVVEAAHERDAWVGVCGEAASDPAVAVALVGLGVDELSMTRVAIPEVKATLRSLTQEQCRDALTAARAEADAGAARGVLEAAVG